MTEVTKLQEICDEKMRTYRALNLSKSELEMNENIHLTSSGEKSEVVPIKEDDE
jgi:hypothetical protein